MNLASELHQEGCVRFEQKVEEGKDTSDRNFSKIKGREGKSQGCREGAGALSRTQVLCVDRQEEEAEGNKRSFAISPSFLFNPSQLLSNGAYPRWPTGKPFYDGSQPH